MTPRLGRSFCPKKFACAAGLVILTTALAAACGSAEPEDVEISVSLQDKQMTPETIRVSQDDTVTLKLDSDTPGSFHLHGYDVGKEVTPGTVADFVFVPDATGRWRIAFHPATYGGHGHGDSGGSDSGSSHAGKSHEVLESETPVSVGVMAEPDDMGGVDLRIVTDGWRWAPQEVNMADAPGAGHAHVYVDGVKINRVYGPYYHLADLEPGMREIRVALNTNSHNELTYAGRPLEATTMVDVDQGHTWGDRDGNGVEADATMSVAAMARPDPLGGYNLQVMTTGFEFTPHKANEDHVAGEGMGYVSIDGKTHARLYTPWLKLPSLEPGMHQITVSLAGNQGNPYRWQGSPVEDSIVVHAGAEEQPDGSHDQGASEDSAQMGHDAGEGDTGDAAETPAVEAEYDVGYLEVHPR